MWRIDRAPTKASLVKDCYLPGACTKAQLIEQGLRGNVICGRCHFLKQEPKLTDQRGRHKADCPRIPHSAGRCPAMCLYDMTSERTAGIRDPDNGERPQLKLPSKLKLKLLLELQFSA